MRRIRVAAILLSLFAMLDTGLAQAQEWHYRVRPGDDVWTLAGRHLRDDISWQRLQAHNAIVDPLRLVPGSVMRFPVRWLRQQPAPARIIAVVGNAIAHDPSTGTETPVVADMRLGAGITLRTMAGASLTLEFADASRLLLQAESELLLDKLGAYGTTGMVDTRLRLPRGRTDSDVKRLRGPASRFIIETPTAMSSVRGTGYRVGSDGTRSQVEVTEGWVAVGGAGREVAIASGEGTFAAAGAQPSTPRRLLPAPDPASIAMVPGEMPARLAWTRVEGASAYRVQIAGSADFPALLHDHIVDTAGDHPPGLPAGDYHLRVRAIDRDGIEGHDAVAVVPGALPAPFAIAPAQGSEVDAAHPRFRWAAMTGARYRLQIADAAGFSSPLVDAVTERVELRCPQALPPGDYAWRVAAIDASGRATAFGDGVPFSVHAPGAGPQLEQAGEAADPHALQVRWQASAKPGQRYRFQLARDPGFTRIEVEREVDEPQITLPDLGAGSWHARVQTVDSDGYAGPYGPTQTLTHGCRLCRYAIGGGALLLLLAL